MVCSICARTVPMDYSAHNTVVLGEHIHMANETCENCAITSLLAMNENQGTPRCLVCNLSMADILPDLKNVPKHPLSADEAEEEKLQQPKYEARRVEEARDREALANERNIIMDAIEDALFADLVVMFLMARLMDNREPERYQWGDAPYDHGDRMHENPVHHQFGGAYYDDDEEYDDEEYDDEEYDDEEYDDEEYDDEEYDDEEYDDEEYDDEEYDDEEYDDEEYDTDRDSDDDY